MVIHHCAIDLGMLTGNNYQPIGAGSVTVWDQITQLGILYFRQWKTWFSDFLANDYEIGVKGEAPK